MPQGLHTTTRTQFNRGYSLLRTKKSLAEWNSSPMQLSTEFAGIPLAPLMHITLQLGEGKTMGNLPFATSARPLLCPARKLSSAMHQVPCCGCSSGQCGSIATWSSGVPEIWWQQSNVVTFYPHEPGCWCYPGDSEQSLYASLAPRGQRHVVSLHYIHCRCLN